MSDLVPLPNDFPNANQEILNWLADAMIAYETRLEYGPKLDDNSRLRYSARVASYRLVLRDATLSFTEQQNGNAKKQPPIS